MEGGSVKIIIEIKGDTEDEKKLDTLASNIDRLIVRYTGDENLTCIWNMRKEGV